MATLSPQQQALLLSLIQETNFNIETGIYLVVQKPLNIAVSETQVVMELREEIKGQFIETHMIKIPADRLLDPLSPNGVISANDLASEVHDLCI